MQQVIYCYHETFTEQIFSKSRISVSLLGLHGECPFICQVESELLVRSFFELLPSLHSTLYQLLQSWVRLKPLLFFHLGFYLNFI